MTSERPESDILFLFYKAKLNKIYPMISSYILMSYNKKGIEGTFKSYFSVLEKHHVEGQGDGTITS